MIEKEREQFVGKCIFYGNDHDIHHLKQGPLMNVYNYWEKGHIIIVAIVHVQAA